jgi:excisionase family DNA binding protein
MGEEWADLPEWITVEEAAQQSGYQPEYVRRLARQGRIGASKKGRDWWVDRDVFRVYLEAMIALGSRRHDPTALWKPQAQETTEPGEAE